MPIFGTININSILIQIWTPLGVYVHTHVGNYITRLVNTFMILCSGVEPQTPMLLAIFQLPFLCSKMQHWFSDLMCNADDT